MAVRTALLAAGASALALVATGGTLSYYEESLPQSLNPLYGETMVDFRSQELIFDRLWYHDPITNDLKSRIVERWELALGGKGLKIHLKQGIRWHNGAPLTSKDICFTVNAILDKGTTAPLAAQYRTVLAGCKPEGKSTAVIEFTKVLHNPRERLGFAVLPEKEFGGNTAIGPDNRFNAYPIGTGPFKGTRGRRGVNFDGFTNAHHTPGILQMTLQEGNDPLVQVRTLMNNNVQGIIAVPPPLRPEVSASDELALKSYDLRSWWFVAVNTNSGPLADVRVRQALNLLLDRTQLRELSIGVKPGDKNSPCEFISGPFVQASPFYNRSVPTVDRANKAKAFALLKEAGLTQVGGTWTYKGSPVTLRIGMKSNLDNEAPDLLSQVGNQLSAAGFKRQDSKVSVDDWQRKVTTGNAGGEFDLVIGKWSFGIVEDVNHLFETRSGARGGSNIFNYSNPEVDALLQEYDKSRTVQSAQDAYHKLHDKLAEELPYLFLWKLDTRSAWRTEVKGNIIAPYHYFTEIDSWKY